MTDSHARSGETISRAAWFLLDGVLVLGACALGQWVTIRMLAEFGGPEPPRWLFLAFAAVFALVAPIGRRYDAHARFRGARESLRVFAAILTVGAIGVIAGSVVHMHLPGFRTDSAVSSVFAALALALPRIAVYSVRHRRGANGERVMTTIVVGTGESAETLAQWLDYRLELPFDVVGFVESDPAVGKPATIRVLGTVADLPRLIEAHDVDCVIVAERAAPQTLISEVVRLAATAAHPGRRLPVVKVLPDIDELLSGKNQALRVRDVGIDDLVPRQPVRVDLSTLAPHLSNRVVLVTGAGGSIGSELCRQIARFDVSKLVLVDQSENGLVDIDAELREERGFSRSEIVLADVGDAARIRQIFTDHRPHVVFHAAAHKHVPLLESNVFEAIRNNLFGTHVIALSAAAAGVAKFVFVSTDKAVKPTSILGATKRVAERICQSFEGRTGTEFVVVRFGNVLDSSGSMLPIFRRQIERGGPVTVTHPDMQRYFMSISEAVSLVLAAMAIGRDGQVIVMDMGKPVKILEIAEKLIMLAGFVPNEEMKIVFTGVRPGEKLHEEVLTEVEDLTATVHERLFIAQQERIEYDRLVPALAQLELAVRSSDLPAALTGLKDLVPAFQPGKHLEADVDPHHALGGANGQAAAVDATTLIEAERID